MHLALDLSLGGGDRPPLALSQRVTVGQKVSPGKTLELMKDFLQTLHIVGGTLDREEYGRADLLL
jgi:hypothetical protein